MQWINEIAENWDISHVTETKPVKGNSFKLLCGEGESYFLKEKVGIEKVELEESFLSYIKDNGMPVSPPLKTKNGKCYMEYGSKYYALYRFIEGNHLRCNTFGEYKEAVASYGTILEKLHRILASYSVKSDFIKKMDLSSQVFGSAIPTIEAHNIYPEIEEAISKIKGGMYDAFKDLPLQYIHRDFHEDNIMFDGKMFVGLIDFDNLMIGHKIYDICYIMTSILLNGVFDEVYKKNWLLLLPVIIQSYLKENDLSAVELKGLWHVFLASQITFIAYFIKHPNEKLLKENAEGFFYIYKNRKAIDGIFEKKV